MSVLVVEDDVAIGRALVQGLAGKGLPTHWLRQGEGVLALLGREAVATVVLDIGLPDADGFALCRQIRAAGHDMPILMLTARGGLEDRLDGFDAGADDYLAKPFAFAELAARVAVLVRRAGQRPPAPIVREGLEIDSVTGAARWQGEALALEPRSQALLLHLARECGATVARQDLLDAVWGVEAEITDNALDVAISTLRKRLAGTGIGVTTMRGQGFRLDIQAA